MLMVVIWSKGRPFAKGDVFRASRLSTGNRVFPTQVLISPTSVVHFTPEWFGRLEHSIHMAHVASVRIDTNLMFSDVFIETTGGASPIRCHGHRKARRCPDEGADRAIPDGVLPGQPGPGTTQQGGSRSSDTCQAVRLRQHGHLPRGLPGSSGRESDNER